MHILRLIRFRAWYVKIVAAWLTLFVAVPAVTAFWIGPDFWLGYWWLVTAKPFVGLPLVLLLIALAPLWLLPFAAILRRHDQTGA